MNEPVIKEGFAIYDTKDGSYMDEEDYEVEINYAQMYDTLDGAAKHIEDHIIHSKDCEIHKIKITCEIQETYGRKVTYEPVEIQEKQEKQ